MRVRGEVSGVCGDDVRHTTSALPREKIALFRLCT